MLYEVITDSGDNTISYLTGTGNDKSFPGRYGEGTYSVIARNIDSGCKVKLAAEDEITITRNVAPNSFVLSASGVTACASEQNATVTINESQSGVNYELRKNLNLFDTQPGTDGTPITWDVNGSGETSFTVIASDENNNCTSTTSSVSINFVEGPNDS